MHDRTCLRHFGDNVAAVQIVSDRNGQMRRPFLCAVQVVHTDTAGNKRAAGLCDLFQRTLDSVKNIVQDSRCKGNGNRASCCGHFLARTKSRRLFIYLDRCQILVQRDHFSDQFLMSHINHLRHTETGISFQVNDGTVDSVNSTSFKQFRHLPRIKSCRIHYAAVS